MTAKHWLARYWKALGILLVGLVAAWGTRAYDQQVKSSVTGKLYIELELYAWGAWFSERGPQVLAVFAVILGTRVLDERHGNIIKDERKRLLTNYAVNSAVLLAATVCGSLGLLAMAQSMGRSQPIGGVLISTLLLWLGASFALGLGLLFVVIDNNVWSATIAALGALGLLWFVGLLLPLFRLHSLNFFTYWSSYPAYIRRELPAKELLVCLVAAVLPLAATLRLLRPSPSTMHSTIINKPL